MLLIPLLAPFALLAFLMLMERVEVALLGRRPDEEEAARHQRETAARMPEPPPEQDRPPGNAERRRSSSTSGGGKRTLGSGRVVDARSRAIHRHPVRPVEQRPELHRRSA